MSQIKKLATQFRSLGSLKQALREVGYAEHEIEIDPTLQNRLPQTLWGGRTVENTLSVRIRRDVCGCYEDTGFRYADGVFEAVISTHDGGKNFGDGKLHKTTVRYSIAEAKAQALANGYTLTEQVVGDTVQLVCEYTSYSM